jgi:hypothetical protein
MIEIGDFGHGADTPIILDYQTTWNSPRCAGWTARHQDRAATASSYIGIVSGSISPRHSTSLRASSDSSRASGVASLSVPPTVGSESVSRTSTVGPMLRLQGDRILLRGGTLLKSWRIQTPRYRRHLMNLTASCTARNRASMRSDKSG